MIAKWVGRQVAQVRAAVQRHQEYDPQSGLATAEYAIVLVAAAGFAGLLVAILRSDPVREMLLGIVRDALSF